MTTWTAPPTFTAGAILTKAQLDTNVRDNPNYLYEVIHGTNADKIPFAAHDNNAWVIPACHVRLTTAWVMVNNAATAINYNAADIWDTDTIHDTATNNTRLTPHTKGVYLVYSSLAYPGNATGQRQNQLRQNGTTTIGLTQIGSPGATQLTINALAVGLFNGSTDYVEHLYFQDSGGSLTNPGLGNYSTEFGLLWIGGY